MESWSRREFLSASLAAGASGALAGCASDDEPGGDSAAQPTTTTKPASIDDIDHFVILIQENRSFDHYFGTRKGVRGFDDPTVAKRPDGRPVWYQDSEHHPDGYVLPYRFDTTSTSGAYGPDPFHTWVAQHAYWNGGLCDSFARIATVNMGYFTAEDIPLLHALADAFTLCDQSFCSVIGPTTPNRMYSMTGTIDPQGVGGGPVFENFLGPFRWETYPERLQRAGVSWRVYQEQDDFGDNVLEFFANFQGLAETDPLYDGGVKVRTRDAFAQDVASGNLPQVSWIVAPQATSEHPSAGSPAPGHDLTARSLGALMASPKVWAKTAFILTYDENGGYFDHVVPPAPPAGTADEFTQGTSIGLGFRVPTIVASPWTTGGRVNSGVFDHTSMLRLLETRFGVEVPNLSAWRRETCGDLVDVFDFSTTNLEVPDLPDTVAAMTRAEATRSLPPCVPPTTQVEPSVT